MVIILLTIAQATDLSLLTDFGYMSLGRDKSYIQFGLGMMLTIALFRYSISDKFLSRRFGLVIDYWAVLFLITVLKIFEADYPSGCSLLTSFRSLSIPQERGCR